jgi:hypothetical protein
MALCFQNTLLRRKTMELYINTKNIIYYGKPLNEEARELSQEEKELYYRGCGYEIKNGFLVDITETTEYQLKESELEKNKKKEAIILEINEFDKKRIRALCEPAQREDGLSWLDYYTSEIQERREILTSLS